MEKMILFNPVASKTIGPYSPTLNIVDFVFASGKIQIDPSTGNLVALVIKKQSKRSLENLKSVLKPYGANLGHIVNVDIFMQDLNSFSLATSTYSEFLPTTFHAKAM